MSTYEVKPIDHAAEFGPKWVVYERNAAGSRALALCYAREDGQRIVAALVLADQPQARGAGHQVDRQGDK